MQRLSSLVLVACLVSVAGCASGRAPDLDGGRAMGDAARLGATDASFAHDARQTTCTSEGQVCDRAVYDRARAYAMAHPERDGGSWLGASTSLVFRFGELSRSTNDASVALERSTLLGADPSAAPVGAFHWWDDGASGVVGVDLLGGGATVLLASEPLAESWGEGLGVSGVEVYTEASGTQYRGWSMDFLGQQLPGGGCTPACVASAEPDAGSPSGPVMAVVPRSGAQESGTPDAAFWMRMQMFAAGHGYSGAIDGVMSGAAWAGIQRAMRAYGYGGPDDGVPGVNTYAALQRLAAAHGYTGPIDGELGPNSYRGIARFLNSL
jgi:hypothetical protein